MNFTYMFPHPGVQRDYSEGEKDISCGNNVQWIVSLRDGSQDPLWA